MPESNSIFQNSALKLFSLLGAILIWVAIQSDITGGRLPDVFLETRDQERSMVVQLHVLKTASNIEPFRVATNAVAVRIHGESRSMQGFKNDQIRAYIDLTGGIAGNSTNCPVRVDIPDGVALRSVFPETITVTRPAR